MLRLIAVAAQGGVCPDDGAIFKNGEFSCSRWSCSRALRKLFFLSGPLKLTFFSLQQQQHDPPLVVVVAHNWMAKPFYTIFSLEGGSSGFVAGVTDRWLSLNVISTRLVLVLMSRNLLDEPLR